MSPKSKYFPLHEYLRQQPDSALIELSFAEVEEILGKPVFNLQDSNHMNLSTASSSVFGFGNFIVLQI